MNFINLHKLAVRLISYLACIHWGVCKISCITVGSLQAWRDKDPTEGQVHIRQIFKHLATYSQSIQRLQRYALALISWGRSIAINILTLKAHRGNVSSSETERDIVYRLFLCIIHTHCLQVCAISPPSNWLNILFLFLYLMCIQAKLQHINANAGTSFCLSHISLNLWHILGSYVTEYTFARHLGYWEEAQWKGICECVEVPWLLH